MALKISLC